MVISLLRVNNTKPTKITRHISAALSGDVSAKHYAIP